jgi:dephospho-CoA kinase
MPSNKLVIGITGMAGSGKSLVVAVATRNGYAGVVMGDEIREEAKRRNLPSTPENLGKIMLELRQAEGETVIAKRCVSRIERAAEQKVIVDGIRSLAEVEEFKKHFPSFKVIAVHSSPETRFRRLFNRQRSDDPKDQQVFLERDLRELSVGLGNAMAMAEYFIINEGAITRSRDEARQILKKAETKWKT